LKNKQYLFFAEDYEKTKGEDLKEALKGNLDDIKEKIEHNKELTLEQKINMKKAAFKQNLDVIKSQLTKEELDEMTYEEFKKRAMTNAQFLSCFGMFTLFYSDILQPIEKKVNKLLLILVGQKYQEIWISCS
jgi:hypothetical protein